jgi:hypothetical protein
MAYSINKAAVRQVPIPLKWEMFTPEGNHAMTVNATNLKQCLLSPVQKWSTDRPELNAPIHVNRCLENYAFGYQKIGGTKEFGEANDTEPRNNAIEFMHRIADPICGPQEVNTTWNQFNAHPGGPYFLDIRGTI